MPDVLLDTEAAWQAYAWNVAGQAVNHDPKTDAQTDEWATAQFTNNVLTAINRINSWANDSVMLGTVGLTGVHSSGALTLTADGGDLVLDPGPGGSDNVVIDGLTWPGADGTSGQVLTTNGSGVLSWADGGGDGSAWAAILAVGAVSGGTSPVLSSGDELRSPDGASTNDPGIALVIRPGAGDGEGAGGDLDLHGGTAGDAGSGGNVNLRPAAMDGGIVDGRVAVIPAWAGDTSPFLALEGNGTNSATARFFAGDRDPNSNVTGDPGDLYIRAGDATAKVYQHRGGSSSNDDWVDVAAQLEADSVQELKALGTDDGISVDDRAVIRATGNVWVCLTAAATTSTWKPGAYAVNPLDYGCDPSGATNDNVALQEILTDIEARGGGAVGLPGLFRSDADLSLVGDVDVVIFGYGWLTGILPRGSGTHGIVVGATDEQRKAYIHLRNFLVDGESGTGDGIKCIRQNELRIEGVRVRSMGNDGIALDRCYSQWVDHCYVNNNGRHGLYAGPQVGAFGNDNMSITESHFMANVSSGVQIEGSCSGLKLHADIEGNGNGLVINAGALNQSSGLEISVYCENNIGKNVSLGEDAGPAFLEALSLGGCVFNPGTVDAATNTVSLDRVRDSKIEGSHFSSCNLTYGTNTVNIWLGRGNKWSSSVGPDGVVPTDDEHFDTVGETTSRTYVPKGGGGRKVRMGAPFDATRYAIANNLALASSSTGNLDRTDQDGSAIDLYQLGCRLMRARIGSNPRTLEQVSFDVPIFVTASLPAAVGSMNGKIAIEDPAGSEYNLVLYAGGTRHTILGSPALDDVLANGNVSGGNDVVISAGDTLTLGDGTDSPEQVFDVDSSGVGALRWIIDGVLGTGAKQFEFDGSSGEMNLQHYNGGWIDIVNFTPTVLSVLSSLRVAGDIGDASNFVGDVYTDGLVAGLQAGTSITSDDTAWYTVDNSAAARTFTFNEGEPTGRTYFIAVLSTAEDVTFQREGSDTVNGGTGVAKVAPGDVQGLYIAVKNTSTNWQLYGPLLQAVDTPT